jgi:hypothetical protein
MNEFDPALASALDRIASREDASSDWADVLARAGHRTDRHRLRVAVLALAVAFLALPALGLGGGPLRSLFGAEKRPIRLVAELEPVAGSGAGTFVAEPTGAIFRLPPNSQLGRRGAFAQTVRFTLYVHSLSGPATSARIALAPSVRGDMPASAVRLCSPCTATTTGIVRARRLMLALLTGRATIEVATKAHPDGELRGRVTPRR